MNRFKVGDNVIRLKGGATDIIDPEVGSVQTVFSIIGESGYIRLEGLGGTYSERYFDLCPKSRGLAPQPHRDLIIAWANGENIQVRDPDSAWKDSPFPGWRAAREYRIKPSIDEMAILSELNEIEGYLKKLSDQAEVIKNEVVDLSSRQKSLVTLLEGEKP